MNVPVIHCRQAAADAAYAAHKALLLAEQAAPLLREMPAFTMAKQDAYERFAKAFARL